MTKIKIALLLSLVAIPSLVFGAGVPPSNVQGVHVSNANGIITVTWQPAKDDTSIAFYRVYYSRASILGNDGNYDDFDRTRGAETAYSFTKIPVQGSMLYVGVLAVDTDGNESEGFEMEGSVALTSAVASTPAASEPQPVAAPVAEQPVIAEQPADTSPVTYTAVTPVSATGLLLSFSKELDPVMSLDTTYFSVKDASGTVLNVTQAVLGGSNILLTTEPQIPLTFYIVSILTTLQAKDGSVFPSSTPGVQFLGFPRTPQAPQAVAVAVPAVVPEPAPVAGPPQQVYVQNPLLAQTATTPLTVRLVPMKQGNGTYTVLAQWRGGSEAAVGYAVSLSTDGEHFDAPINVSSSESSMQFENIKAGSNVVVRVVERGQSGQAERSNFSATELPASGVGILGIAGVAGALAARRMKKRQKKC